MRILIVTQYFWPENFRINDMALALKERGHHVEVLTGKPNYPKGDFTEGYGFFSKRTETWNDITIHRAPLFPRGNGGGVKLMLNYLSFAFFSSLRSLSISGHFDKILVYEPSPITVGIPAILLKYIKKAPIYFWVQDLWPQSVTAAGGVNNKWILTVLDSVTRWIYKKSDKLLIQSEAFRSLIEKQGVPSEKIIFYPNSVERLFQVTTPDPQLLQTLPAGFKIMFAGNIGEAQDFETIVEAVRQVAKLRPDVKWIILGDGRKRPYLEKKIEELHLQDQLFLMGSFPVSMMPSYYACADCLLVSLKKDYIFSLTIPSKIQSYLACGKPILASLDGEGGAIVKQAGAGLVVEAEYPQGLAQRVLELCQMNQDELLALGQNGRTYFEANFERELLVDRLEQIFNAHV